MDELLAKIKNWTLASLLKATPFDGGPSSTRVVVLSVNATICIVELSLCVAACIICLRHNAATNLAVIGALLTAMSAIVVPLLGFAMSMKKAHDDMRMRAMASTAVATQTGADGSESTAVLKTGT